MESHPTGRCQAVQSPRVCQNHRKASGQIAKGEGYHLGLKRERFNFAMAAIIEGINK